MKCNTVIKQQAFENRQQFKANKKNYLSNMYKQRKIKENAITLICKNTLLT